MPRFPFTAVVGADDLSTALVLTAISPAIGGVLVRGEKGTAKSTIVRGLVGVLPRVDVVAGCRFSCDPADPARDCPDGPHPIGADAAVTAERRPTRLVELPVGASDDRVTGSMDLAQALGAGRTEFHPGLLAQAHRGLLYVDEVNLLADHLVEGSKESRMTQSLGKYVMVTGHPFIDIWAAVKPASVGIEASPHVQRGEAWKTGTCERLGWGSPQDGWRRVQGAVTSFRDLDASLIGAVERLVDFVTDPDS